MKEFFKYSNGYINCNDENLYLTNSGNWSETKELLEKSTKSVRKNAFKKGKYYVFFSIIGAIFLFSITVDNGVKRIVPIGLIVVLILAYRYFSNEMGNTYKIPLEKIKNIEINKKDVRLVFLNLNGVEDFEIVPGVEKKGLVFFSELQKRIISS